MLDRLTLLFEGVCVALGLGDLDLGAGGGVGGPGCGGLEDEEEEEPRGDELAEHVQQPVIDVQAEGVGGECPAVEGDADGADEEDGAAEHAHVRDVLHDVPGSAEPVAGELADEQDAPREEQQRHGEGEERAVARLDVVQQHVLVGDGGHQHQQDDPDDKNTGGRNDP